MIASFAAALLLGQSSPPAAPPADPAAPRPSDWHRIPDGDILVMTLADGRTVVIRLATAYAPEHVANLRRLASAHYWDGTRIYRVQDNWVTQWGGQPDDPPADPGNKPLPADIAKAPAAEYEIGGYAAPVQPVGADAYARATGITADGWTIASDAEFDAAASAPTPVWLAHCYATVGVARDAAPNTGSGSELFMPIGGSARRLDRNYTIVGRVIENAGVLSGLPRGAMAMGMYPAGERIPIVSIRLASELPAAGRPQFEYRAADNPRFAAMVAARRRPAAMVASGGIDVCDVPLATRRVSAR